MDTKEVVLQTGCKCTRLFKVPEESNEVRTFVLKTVQHVPPPLTSDAHFPEIVERIFMFRGNMDSNGRRIFEEVVE